MFNRRVWDQQLLLYLLVLLFDIYRERKREREIGEYDENIELNYTSVPNMNPCFSLRVCAAIGHIWGS